jgi:hypothetical protein
LEEFLFSFQKLDSRYSMNVIMSFRIGGVGMLFGLEGMNLGHFN